MTVYDKIVKQMNAAGLSRAQRAAAVRHVAAAVEAHPSDVERVVGELRRAHQRDAARALVVGDVLARALGR